MKKLYNYGANFMPLDNFGSDDGQPVDLPDASPKSGEKILLEEFLAICPEERERVERLRKAERFDSFASVPPEVLKDYLVYLEKCMYAASKRGGGISIPFLSGLHPDISHWLSMCANLKMAAEGTTEKNFLDYERKVLEAMSPEKYAILIKLGQDGPREYAPIVSKLLHALSFGKDFGKEKKDEAHGKRSTDVALQRAKLQRSRNPAERELAYRAAVGGAEYTTAQERLSQVPFFLSNALHFQKGIKMEKLFEEKLTDVVRYIAINFLQAFYARDGGHLTRQNIYELTSSVGITAQIKHCYEAHYDSQEDSKKLMTKVIQYLATTMEPEFISDLTAQIDGFEPDSKEVDAFVKICNLTIKSLKKLAAAQTSPDGARELYKFTEEYFSKDRAAFAEVPMLRFAAFVVNKRRLLELNAGRAASIIKAIIGYADNPFEMVTYLTVLIDRENPHVAATLDEYFNIVASRSGQVKDFVKNTLPFTYRHDPASISLDFVLQLFSGDRIKEGSPIVQELFGLLLNPDYATFYNACVLCAAIIERENASDSFSNAFGMMITSAPNYAQDPLCRLIMRNIAERLPAATRLRFLVGIRIPANDPREGKALALLADSTVKLVFQDMLSALDELERSAAESSSPPAGAAAAGGLAMGTHAVKNTAAERQERKAKEKAERERKYNAPIALIASLNSLASLGRDLAGLISEVQRRRTITLSDVGHKVNVNPNNIDSPFSVEFPVIRIKRSGKTGNPAEGIACNAVISHKNGANIYCSLEPNGELMMRLMDEHGTEHEKVGREEALRRGIQNAAFDELHYLLLYALKIIYVRNEKPAEAQQDPQIESLAGSGGQESTSGVSSPKEAQLTADLLSAQERESGEMVMDLTDTEKARRKRRAKLDKVFIGSNREKIWQIFSPLTRSAELPENLPEEFKDAVLHQAVVINGTAIFEPFRNIREVYAAIREGRIKMEEVYVRKNRVFTVPLPYADFRKDLFGENEQIRTLHIARQKRRTQVAEAAYETFIGSEHGESLDMEPVRGVLSFDAPDTPHNRKLLEHIKSEDNTANRIRRLEEFFEAEIRRTRRELRQKYLSGDSPDILAYSEAMRRYEDIIAAIFEEEVSYIRKSSEKSKAFQEAVKDPSDPNMIRIITKIRLAQSGFTFNQTFNQGQFQTLAEFLGSMSPGGIQAAE